MLRTTLTLLFIASISIVLANNCATNPLPDASYESGYCGFYHFVNFGRQAGGLIRPRGIDTAPNGDLITVDSNTGNIWAVYEDGNGQAQGIVIGNQPGLNHACRYYQGFIYASSDVTVYRWTYNGRSSLSNQQTVIVNMPAGGAHNTRTVEFQGTTIYVNIGSGSNIDADDSRAKIITASLTSSLPVDYNAASVYVRGTRNSVGLRFDPTGVLWSAENSLEIPGGPNYANNPADTLKRFTSDVIGKFFGYPYCYTEGWVPGQTSPARNPGLGPRTQWAVNPNSQYDDAWCQNPANVVKPSFAIRAHEAPLDLYFYTGSGFNRISGLPITVNHGAVNRSISVYALNADGSANTDTNSLRRLVYGPTGWQIAPVAMTVAPCKAYGQCIFFTDDGNGGANPGIHALAYAPNAATTNTPATSNSGTPATSNSGNSGSDTCQKADYCNANLCACAGACYDPSSYCCQNGQLTQAAFCTSTPSTGNSNTGTSAANTGSSNANTGSNTANTGAATSQTSQNPGTPATSSSGNTCQKANYCSSTLCACNGACYDPASYCCQDNKLTQAAFCNNNNNNNNNGNTATSGNQQTSPITSSTCSNMFAQLQCRTSSEDPAQVDTTAVTNARSWLCSNYPKYCNDIGTTGKYASCNSVEQLSYAMSSYYTEFAPSQGANACNFGGLARLYATGTGSGSSTTTNSGTPATSNSGTPATSNGTPATSNNNCQNMFAQLQCRTASENPAQVDAQAVTNARNWLCGKYGDLYCTDIQNGGQYSSCNTVEQLSNAMNKYYLAVGPTEGASACNFNGVAQLYTTSNAGQSASCTSMFSSLKCRTASENPANVDAQAVANARTWLCANYGKFCTDINVNGKYSACNTVEQISYAMNLYYNEFAPSQGANACNFNGVGQLY